MEEVEFEIVCIFGFEDKVDVNYNVKEQLLGLFNVGIGYGDRIKLSLQVGI